MSEQRKQIGTLMGRPVYESKRARKLEGTGIAFGRMEDAVEQMKQEAIDRYNRQRRAPQ